MPDAQQVLALVNESGVGWAELARAALNTAPFTGGVASLWSDVISHQRQKRVEAAIDELRERLLAAADRFDPARVGEAEFELLADGMSRLAREHREQKRQRFVRLIESSWCHTEVPFEHRALFNKALDEFEDFHIQVLKVLRSGHTNGEQPMPFNALAENLFGTMTDEQRSTLLYPALSVLCPTGFAFVSRKGLESKGLMLRGPFSPEWPITAAGYWINPLGQKFLEFLREPD